MNIYPNLTLIVLQLIPFIVTLFALNAIIFKPMMQYLDERENASGGASEKAKQLHKETEAKLQELNARLKEANAIASDKKTSSREALMSNYNEAIALAREEADRKLKDAAVQITTEQTAASQELKTQAESLAKDIASQTLGRTLA